MASKRICRSAQALLNGSLAPTTSRNAVRHYHPSLTRSMATEPILPSETIAQSYENATLTSASTGPILTDTFSEPPPPAPASSTYSHRYQQPPNPFLKTATCTLHSFPSFEPTSYATYPGSHLLLPVRRDILHRAVIFEGDKTRQGTANVKWRDELKGSSKKVRPQKGTGSARLGDSKSPMLKGGAKAFGPKTRDFSTDLPRKIYDLAWRMALSYRYRRGELIVIDGEAEIDMAGPGTMRWVKEMLEWNKLGNAHGRSLFVTLKRRGRFFGTLESGDMGREAKAMKVGHVDVKDLLERGHVVIEKAALDRIFAEHSHDLESKVKLVA